MVMLLVKQIIDHGKKMITKVIMIGITSMSMIAGVNKIVTLTRTSHVVELYLMKLILVSTMWIVLKIMLVDICFYIKELRILIWPFVR